MAKVPKRIKDGFTKKKRGTKKFVADNINLIRTESQQAGLLEYDPARLSYVMPKVVSPEMIEVAKAAQQRAKKGNHSPMVGYNILRGEQKPAKRNTDWAILWAALDVYDKAHKSTVTAALKLWLDKNPEVKQMKNKARVEALTKTATKIIAYLDKQAGRDTASELADALNPQIKNNIKHPNLLPLFVSEVKQCQPPKPEHKRIKIRKLYSTVYRWRPLKSLAPSIA